MPDRPSFSAACPEAVIAAESQETQSPPPQQPTLGVVATAHLDTQWRWTIRRTISEFLPRTLRDNLALLDRYPGYTFSFEGAFRYMLLREYYPREFERLRKYIREGRWRVTGSWLDAVDVNIPSFESLVRHTLYGNGYFRREFGKTSRDIFLPDCFGFGYALPSIAAHCGLKSFSTQKLTWGGCTPPPFDIGMWEGVDGSAIVAAIQPGEYVSPIEGDLSRDPQWIERVARQGSESELYAAYMYFGVGDQGGAPKPEAVAWLEHALESDGPLTVRSIGADDLVELAALNPEASLQRYNGELLLTRHGIGCYTSQAALKRWNRKNELLADAAERAAVTAALLAGANYPREELRDAWTRFLWHQFHDDLTGTSIPEAYEFSWNDEILSVNRFASLLEHATGAASATLDTRVEGVPLVVYNPLSIDREDVVEATVRFDSPVSAVRVFDPDGREVPAQILNADGAVVTLLFAGSAPANGYAVYDIRPAETAADTGIPVKVTRDSLENERYRVTLNAEGQVASIFDKRHYRELLAAPITLELLHNKPSKWPAWEIEYDDIMREPRAIVGEERGATRLRVLESGSVRGAIEITQHYGRSTFRTIVRLASGDAGNRLEFVTDINWYEPETLLKAAFRFTTPNENVTYDLGLGAVERGTNTSQMYEVPGHQWADLTASDRGYGVSVLNDCRYGWDHPDCASLRLTLLHTPGLGSENFTWAEDECSQDMGRHTLAYALVGHPGDWREGGIPWQAARFNQPLVPFQVPKHCGKLGRTFSLCRVVSNGEPADTVPPAAINTVKLAEETDEIVVRVRELLGRPAEDIVLFFPWPIKKAREINGSEDPIGIARIENGLLRFNLTPYQPKAFAVRLAKPTDQLVPPVVAQPLDLPFNLVGTTVDGAFSEGDFDGHGNTLAAELLPRKLVHRDIPFTFAPATPGACNAVRCDGQRIPLPEGDFNRLCILAAAVDGPTEGVFSIDGRPHPVWVQDYAANIGQWDNRLRGGKLFEDPHMITPAYINRQPVAWYGTHRHAPEGNDPYRFTYLYLLTFNLTSHGRELTLPSNSRIRVLAASVARTCHDRVESAYPLYDEADGAVITVDTDGFSFIDRTTIRLASPVPGAMIRYTIDGSDPAEDSQVYTTPVTFDRTGILKARAFVPGSKSDYITHVPVTKVAAKKACSVVADAPGLLCRYYEGTWRQLPDFNSLPIVAETVIPEVAVPALVREEYWGVVLTGYLRIPDDGVYEFFLTSDDGSRLAVSGAQVVDNDGIHGAVERRGEVALRAGLHPIRVEMFNGTAAYTLKLAWRGRGFDKQPVPADLLVHAE